MLRREWERLREGDIVAARVNVYDLPPDKSWKHADPGDLGIVVHVEPGHRCVRWKPRGTYTDVAPFEIRFPSVDDFSG
jgi:hypothetical protein